MSKGARTAAEIDRAVSILRTRDSARARELKALRADLDALEAALADERAALLRLISESNLPAAHSTSVPIAGRTRAGAALGRARLFLRRIFAQFTIR